MYVKEGGQPPSRSFLRARTRRYSESISILPPLPRLKHDLVGTMLMSAVELLDKEPVCR